MRYPKNFAKLNSLQQEQWLVAKLIELHNLEQEIKTIVALVFAR